MVADLSHTPALPFHRFNLHLAITMLLRPPRRMNSKLREKGKKDEGRRLREFVDTAYRLDPRVAARKEMQAAER